jgi:Flp pilus assembly protein TadG
MDTMNSTISRHVTKDSSKKRPEYSRRRGSTLVEFALLVPVLLAILIGIIEFGWLISRTYTVGNATREGARYGSLGKTIADTKARVRGSSNSVAITDAQITLEYLNTAVSPSTWQAWPADTADGKNGVPVDAQLRVTVSVPHTALTGFFPFLKNRNVTQSTVMRREL